MGDTDGQDDIIANRFLISKLCTGDGLRMGGVVPSILIGKKKWYAGRSRMWNVGNPDGKRLSFNSQPPLVVIMVDEIEMEGIRGLKYYKVIVKQMYPNSSTIILTTRMIEGVRIVVDNCTILRRCTVRELNRGYGYGQPKTVKVSSEEHSDVANFVERILRMFKSVYTFVV